MDFIIHTPKISKIKKRNSIVLKSIKPSKKTVKIDDTFDTLTKEQKAMFAAMMAKHGMSS